MASTTLHRTAAYRVEPFDLRLFLEVMDTGTITSAAAAMNLSLAAASARLSALETRVAVRLFDRAKAGTTPTAAGRALARHAQRVLAELDSLHVEMTRFGRGLRGTVRLLCNTAAMSEALPPRLGRFLVRFPNIDVDLQELSSDATLDALRRGAAEVGIVADYVDTTGLEVRPWLSDQLVALLPATGTRGTTRANARSAGRSIRYAQLLERPLVGLPADSGLSRFLLQEARRSGHSPYHRVRVSSFDAAAQLVAAGVGVAVMPLTAANRWRGSAVRIAPLSDRWARRKLLICHAPHARELPGVAPLIDSLYGEQRA